MMENKSYDFLYKLLLIGDSGVGKTSLMLSYVDGIFSNAFISTIGIDFKIKTVEIDGKKVKVQIWDTAGQERFHTITTSYYRSSQGVMLVYDVTDRKSFNNVNRWIDNVSRYADETVELLLVANKIDLESKRVITANEGYNLAMQYKVKYVETSAKYRDDVEKMFNDMIQRIHDSHSNKVTDSNIISDLDTPDSKKSSCCK